MDIAATKPKPFCFVLMPFALEFDDTYRIGIKECCDATGAYCERVDEQIFEGTVLQRIYNQIAKADFIVADLSGRNANVFYEVGYAHALGKRTVLLTRVADDIPFDLKHFPHIVYGNSVGKLRDELTKHVRWCIENPADEGTPQRTDLELYLQGQHVSGSGSIVMAKYHNDTAIDLTLQNCSGRTYESGDLIIGIISPAQWVDFNRRSGLRSTRLPQGGNLWVHKDLPRLFPGAVESARFWIGPQPGPEDPWPVTLVARLLTRSGVRDYPFSLQE